MFLYLIKWKGVKMNNVLRGYTIQGLDDGTLTVSETGEHDLVRIKINYADDDEALDIVLDRDGWDALMGLNYGYITVIHPSPKPVDNDSF